ncbi:integral membrane protein [Microbispora rosea subsp. aerata]|nr:DoxX family protein [Microbispora rosea]GGO14835.1 integral membrane protein [Microbispora rosea subsp. aerata]GIH55607.1 integral membrane protein [Microbispora rosea subsp. aerata]GLJ86551.1 integral membrane protein [Microbispora rosea subsp. aerata]
MKTDQFRGPVLSLFRIVTGLLFACHGVASIFGVLGGNRGTGQAVAFGTWPGWWAAAIQLVFGSLVLIGLLTRVSATLCSGSMAYAYFVVHAPQALFPLQNGGELAALFCWSFFLIAIFGPGAWALDTWIHRMRHPDEEAEPYAPATARV